MWDLWQVEVMQGVCGDIQKKESEDEYNILYTAKTSGWNGVGIILDKGMKTKVVEVIEKS